MRYVLWAILIYVLYKFIVGFVIPVFKVSRQMKKQMKEFKTHMQNQQEQFYQQQNAANPQQNTSTTKTPFNTNKTDEYIDFEEVK